MSELVLPVYTYASQLNIISKIWRYGKGYDKPVDCDMVFDTGATMTTLDIELARRAGYKLSGAEPVAVSGVGKDDIPGYRIIIPYLELDGVDLGPVLVDVIEFSEKSNTAAVLGMNVIRHFTATIDIDDSIYNLDKPNGSIKLLPKYDVKEKPTFTSFTQRDTRFGIWAIKSFS